MSMRGLRLAVVRRRRMTAKWTWGRQAAVKPQLRMPAPKHHEEEAKWERQQYENFSLRRPPAFQLLLTKKKGLHLSRLLTIKETSSEHSKREEQMILEEESASPLLNRKSAKVVKEEENVLVKGKVSGLGKEVSYKD